MTLPEWGQKVLLLAIIPVPRFHCETNIVINPYHTIVHVEVFTASEVHINISIYDTHIMVSQGGKLTSIHDYILLLSDIYWSGNSNVTQLTSHVVLSEAMD